MEYQNPLPSVEHGFHPLKPDERDLHLGDVIDLPKVVPDFILDGGWANNHTQEEDDCSAFAVCLAREMREMVELDREYQFACMKDLVGDPTSFGGDLRDALSVPVKIGNLPFSARPSELNGKPLSYLRYIANWGIVASLMALCYPHRAKSYTFVKPTQGMDAFDTIAATQYYWLLKGEKRPVVFGTWWDWPLSQYVIDKWTGSGSGHAMSYRGKQTVNGVAYLVVQQNYGPSAGQNGLHLFSREVVNASEAIFGCGMFTSFTPDEIRTMMQNGYKLDNNVALATMKAILQFCLDLLAKLKGHVAGLFTR